jgi:hypothetical protein
VLEEHRPTLSSHVLESGQQFWINHKLSNKHIKKTSEYYIAKSTAEKKA